MTVQVHVTAWPPARTVTVDVNGELDTRSASAVSALLTRLTSDIMTTLVVNLGQARLPDALPRVLLAALRAPAPDDGTVRRALVNVPPGVRRPSACAAPYLLWHQRDRDVLPWQQAMRHAEPAPPAAGCDCDSAENGDCAAVCGPTCAAAPEMEAAAAGAVRVSWRVLYRRPS